MTYADDFRLQEGKSLVDSATEDYQDTDIFCKLASAQLLADFLEVAGNRQLRNPDGEAASATKADL